MTAQTYLTRENAELRRRLGEAEIRLTYMTRETPAEERDALAAAQARADSVAALHGERVSEPKLGESSLAYRMRLVRDFIKYSPGFKGSVPADNAVLSLVESQVYADAAVAARTAAEAKPGVLTPYVEIDGAGRRITKFHGDNLAFMAPFMLGGQRGKFSRNS